MDAVSEARIVVDNREKLFSQLIVIARPADHQTQDLEETNNRFISVLDEALQHGAIDDDILKGILEHVLRHLEEVRDHMEDARQANNLWRLHNNFCLNLRIVVFPVN